MQIVLADDPEEVLRFAVFADESADFAEQGVGLGDIREIAGALGAGDGIVEVRRKRSAKISKRWLVPC